MRANTFQCVHKPLLSGARQESMFVRKQQCIFPADLSSVFTGQDFQVARVSRVLSMECLVSLLPVHFSIIYLYMLPLALMRARALE